MQVTKNQIKAINAILARTGQMDNKPAIIANATNGRTTHSTELTVTEAKALLSALNSHSARAEDPRKKMFATIVRIAHNMGWVRTLTVVGSAGMEKKKDYTILHEWIAKYGYLHKPLNSYSYQELPRLISQIEAVYKHYLSKI